ncbi:MAG: WcaI family glycosyltransferase [Lewinella sp.]
MKLLIYGINYAPELTGIGKYTGEMASYFAEKGHEVSVICAPPYYPAWKVAADYRGRGWVVENIDGVKVQRCPLYVPAKVSGVKRILHEASFLLSSMRYWIPSYFRRYDAIVCVSPPFHLGFPALIHKWLRGTPVISHIQDLQVDAARDLKIIRNKPLLNLLERMEKFLLKRMTYVSTISKGMHNRILKKGIPENRMIFFPNWVDRSIIYPVKDTEELRAEWGYGAEDRIVLYSGNLGQKQGLEIICESAEQFRDNTDVHFLIIGEGGIKEELVAIVEQKKLKNVTFKNLQPIEKLAACLSAADVHLVLQKKAAADLVLPSKLTNILAVGGHALVTAEPHTTLYEIVNEHQLGTLVEPENTSALSEGLEAILSEKRKNDASGAEGYAGRYLDKTEILSAFEQELLKIVN